MSLIKANAVQIGQSNDATDNFTLAVPSSPDGTIKLARGNSGATTQDVMNVSNAGVVSFPQGFSGNASSSTALATGSTAARPLANRFADVVNVKDFLCSDGLPVAGDGVHDDTTGIQAAINQAQLSNTSSVVYIPSTIYSYRTTNTLNITKAIKILGDGINGFLYPGIEQKNSRLFFDHLNIGIKISTDYNPSGCVIDGIETKRNQPIPSSTYPTPWTPIAADYDISADELSGIDLTIRNCLIRNATNGIKILRSGRASIFNVKLHAFNTGIYIDRSGDVCRIENTHIYPMWIFNDNIFDYMRQNLTALFSGRNDNPHVTNFFAWGIKYGIHLGTGTGPSPAITKRFLLSQFGIDEIGDTAILISGNESTAQITNGYSTLGNHGIVVTASHTKLVVSNYRSTNNDLSAIKILGGDNDAQFTGITLDLYNNSNTAGQTAIYADPLNRVYVDGKLIATTTGTEDKINSYSSIESNEWFDYTPTVRSTVGTITSYTASGKIRRQAGTISYYYVIIITNAGTGSGDLLVGIPYQSLSYACGNGQETTSLDQIYARLSPAQPEVVVRKYDGSSVVGTGKTVVLEGEYIIQ